MIRLLFLVLTTSCFADSCFFIPPKGWSMADPQKLRPHTKVAFVEKTATINLSTEEADVTLATYVECVKKDNQADPNRKWRDLGVFKTGLGEGRLTEIEIKAPGGILRQMQLIVMKDKTAYILTASAPKEEFSAHYHAFEAAFKSLQAVADLTDPLSPAKKTELQSLLEKDPKGFEEKFINDFTEMGPYWQSLYLAEYLTKRTL